MSTYRYVDKWRYLESGQEKKKGFLTSDFSKRDEFSNTVRTLQWREQLAVSPTCSGVLQQPVTVDSTAVL